MVSQSSSVGYTIMGKTADLTVVHKRQPLTPCTRRARHKRSLLKRLAVHRALCPHCKKGGSKNKIKTLMSSAGVGPLCFLRSRVNAAVYQEVLEHFMLPAADQLYGDADFIFQQDLAPAHRCQSYQYLV